MAYKNDVLELLMDDHREAERLFAAYEATDAPVRRRALAEQLADWAVRHLAAAERHLQPALAHAVPEGELTVAAWPAHRAAAEAAVRAVRETEEGGPTAPAFDRAVRALMGWIQQHIAQEEAEVFPRLRANLTHRERFELGAGVDRTVRHAPAPGPGVLGRVRIWLAGGV